MSNLKNTILVVLPTVFIFVAFQNCSNNGFSSKDRGEISSDNVSTATIEVAAVADSSQVVLEVPSHLISENVDANGFQWFFIDEDKNEINLQNFTTFFDLSGLDPNSFLGGHFLVKMPDGSDIDHVAFVFRRMDTKIESTPSSTIVLGMVIGKPVVGLVVPAESPVLGLPEPIRPVIGSPEPIRPVIGSPEPIRPVIGSPEPIRPVIGSPEPIRPVIGSPEPIRPVIGLPEPIRPVIGLPEPIRPVIGLPEPIRPVIGLPEPIRPVIGSPEPIRPVIGIPKPVNPEKYK